MHWIVIHLQEYKDAILAAAALLSPFLALFAAVLASTFAAWATLRAAEKQRQTTITITEQQTRATVRATNRQNWIDQLRSETAAFVSLLPTVVAKAQKREGDLAVLGQQLNLHAAKVHLLVSPTDCGCQKLSKLIEKAAELATAQNDLPTIDWEPLNDIVHEIIETAQEVFAEHWSKIKNLD